MWRGSGAVNASRSIAVRILRFKPRFIGAISSIRRTTIVVPIGHDVMLAGTALMRAVIAQSRDSAVHRAGWRNST
jgi:hypothetical protein